MKMWRRDRRAPRRASTLASMSACVVRQSDVTVAFETADAMASRLGVPHDAQQRIAAGVTHTLRRAAESGHVYLPQEALEGIENEDGRSRARPEPAEGMKDGETQAQDSGLSTQHYLPNLTDRQSQILTLMGSDPVNIDLLIDRSELSAQEILQEMTLLTLRGQVKRVDGQTFVRHNFIKS